MPLNVVIELCKITKASKLFQRNFYLPLLEPLSPKDALRRHLIANEAQLHRMEHYIPVLEEYEKRQARRKLIVKGQVKKRQKKKASMKYVMPLLDMNMPGHSKLRNIFIRKSKGQGQCYTYRVPDKNCTVVITHQMERAIRDKDIIDVMVAQKNDKVVFVLKNNQKVSVPLVNYEGDAPFYRGDGWTNKEIESTHHYGKETMAITHVFEGKEQTLEEWELDMMDMAALRKKKMKCEDTREWKALMSNQANYIDWELFESQAKQIVQEQYTPAEDQPISMKVSSMENTMNVNEKLQKSGKAVIELLPAVADIPEIIKAMKDDGELTEVANVSGVKVKYMDKDYFVPGQMVKWEDSDLLVPGQTIFNENGDTEYVPGFTVAIEGSPTLIPGLVVGDDPNKPIFLPGVSTITESGFLKFEETEDDLPQDLDRNSDDEEFEEEPVPPKQTVLESNIRTKRQIRELPDVVKDSETAVQALPLQDEGNGGNEAGDEMESENGDDIEDETESITSVIEVSQARIDTPTSIAGEEVDVKEEEMMAYSLKTPTTEFLGTEKRALAEENPSISMQLAEGNEDYKTEEPNESMDQGDKKLNEDVTEKEKKGGNKKTKTTKTEGEKAEDENSTKTLTSEFLVTEKGALADENPSISMPLDERKEDNKKEEPNENMDQKDEELNTEVTEKEEPKEGDNRKTKTTKTEGEKAEDEDSTKTSEFLVAEKGALAEENPSIPMQLDERKEEHKKEEPNENMEQGDEKLNEEVTGKEELKEEVNEKTITNNTEGEKTEEDKIGEKCDLMLEGGDPEPASLSSIHAIAVTSMDHPKDEENLANEATNENLATMMEQTTNIRLLVEQVSKVEDTNDQFVKVEIENQSIREHTENDQIEKDKQQTQKEQEANTSPKEQTHEVTIKKILKEQDANERRENQEKLEVEQPPEGLVAQEQEDANHIASNQVKLKQTALKHTAEEKLTKQAERKEKADEHNIQSQTEKRRVLGEYTTHKEELEDSASKMQQAKARMENQALEKDNSDTQTVKVLVVYKDQVEDELPKEKDSTSKQTLEVPVSREQPDKTEMVTHVDKKQAPEGSTVEKKVTINLPAKVFFEEILKNDNTNRQTVVKEEKDAEEIPDEKSSKEIKSWSTIVKELFEVSAVVAGCYFINQLGKNVFNISI